MNTFLIDYCIQTKLILYFYDKEKTLKNNIFNMIFFLFIYLYF